MFRAIIVIWLVLLVLALSVVVAFVTRVIEKCRLAERLSKSQKEPFLSYRVVNRRSWTINRPSRHTGRLCLL